MSINGANTGRMPSPSGYQFLERCNGWFRECFQGIHDKLQGLRRKVEKFPPPPKSDKRLLPHTGRDHSDEREYKRPFTGHAGNSSGAGRGLLFKDRINNDPRRLSAPFKREY